MEDGCCTLVDNAFDSRDYLRDGSPQYPIWNDRTVESYTWRMTLSDIKSAALAKGQLLQDHELYNCFLVFISQYQDGEVAENNQVSWDNCITCQSLLCSNCYSFPNRRCAYCLFKVWFLDSRANLGFIYY